MEYSCGCQEKYGRQGGRHPAVTPLRAVFPASSLLRVVSQRFLKFVREPEEGPVGRPIRILRHVRGLNTTNGFQALLHPFGGAPAAVGDPEKQAPTD